MKKVIALLLMLVMVLSMTACGGSKTVEEPAITRAAEETAPAAQETAAPTEAAPAAEAAAPAASAASYTFVTDGVELVPGSVFDPTILPEAQSVFQVPSCAIVGTDNLYNYGTFELTAFDDGTNELIYSILLIDPNIATTEGLALGDPISKMVELYGEGYAQEGSAYVYTGADQLLRIIPQGETVASIEYLMIVE